MTKCVHCKSETSIEDDGVTRNGNHHYWTGCIAAVQAREAVALARAEAAEAERNELRERHDNLKTAYANLVEEAAERLVRMYAAERRVAELEAQLAAQGMRDDDDNQTNS